MSNSVNDELFSRAREQMDYWSSTIREKEIQFAYDSNDLERLEQLVSEAEKTMFVMEYQPDTSDSVTIPMPEKYTKPLNQWYRDNLSFEALDKKDKNVPF